MLLTGLIATCSAQDRKTPIMITSNRDKIAFYTDLVNEPITVSPIFKVTFTNRYHPGDSNITVKNVNLTLVMYGIQPRFKLIESSIIENHTATQLEQYIWSICNGFIKEWMKDQPYLEYFQSRPIQEVTPEFYGSIPAFKLLPTPEYQKQNTCDNNQL